MKSSVIFCCLLVAVVATDSDWESFKSRFGRKYKSSTEEAFRKKIFLNNLLEIERHNNRHAKGKTTFKLGINNFADLTTQEFTTKMNGLKIGNRNDENVQVLPPSKNVGRSFVNIDWRHSGCVTAVKNQGQCGSCYTFSATGSTEFYNCRAGRCLVSLSEQNLIDCTYKYGNLGCNGGVVDSAFKYIIDNNGIDTGASYPYEERSSVGNCRFNRSTVGGTLRGYKDIVRGSESQLQSAVDNGVVSVGIDASRWSFQLYREGIYDESLCSTEKLDHAVLVVGYGTEALGDYWLVKNSWGKDWGMDGYIKMARNKNNRCGIATQASCPIV